MQHLKARLFGLVLIIVFAGLAYFNWHQLLNQGSYSLKIAAFSPVGIVGGFFLFFFPSKAGKPQTLQDKILALVVFGVGLAAGLLNWYLMDPAFFGR